PRDLPGGCSRSASETWSDLAALRHTRCKPGRHRPRGSSRSLQRVHAADHLGECTTEIEALLEERAGPRAERIIVARNALKGSADARGILNCHASARSLEHVRDRCRAVDD